MTKKLFLILVAASLVQCRSTEKFELNVKTNQCDEALETLPENEPGYKLVSKVQEVSGTLLSYSATGQVLWDVTATLGAVVVLCAPGLAATYVAKDFNSTGHLICIPADIKKIQAPYLGANTLEGTANWNCPDVDSISRSIRKVAKCYNDRGGEDNRKKALSSLQSVEKSGSFYRCLSNNEQKLFLSDLAMVQKSPAVN